MTCSLSKTLHVPAILLLVLLVGVQPLDFSFQGFSNEDAAEFVLLGSSDLARNALQVTYDSFGSNMANLSGRIMYKYPLKLYDKKKNVTSSFNTTFVMNITPVTQPYGGEGVAFIVAQNGSVMPGTSSGQWLGIVNASTNGSASSNILAVEFDTLKSNETNDVDGNHVGLDLNSIDSITQVSLTENGVSLASGIDVVATIIYDGVLKVLNVSVYMFNDTREGRMDSIISYPVDLSSYLPEDVYVGFSASTGVYTQLNCIKSWTFKSNDEKDHPSSRLWIWIVAPLALIIIVVSAFLILRPHWRKLEQISRQEEYPELERAISMSATSPHKCQLKELKQATNNFSSKNKLGEGGFGTVYKGVLHDKEVAVKRISKDSRQGKQEFLSEVTTIGNLHHRNLVKLVGWCYDNNELILVYEFMPNGSLDKLIFGEDEPMSPAHNNSASSPIVASASCPAAAAAMNSWEVRFNIICGVAQALDYLHSGCERRVLHRDIKPSNIMLDLDMNPKLGDFGLARTIKASEKTHHTTKEIAGTPGYMAPEIFHTGRATAETDVYAFGIVLLEVSSGRKPGHLEKNQAVSIAEWVWELHRKDRIIDAIDSRVDRETSAEHREQMECVLILGLACCHPNPFQRPSMRTVMQVLTGEATPLEVPVEKPVFMWPAMHASFNLISADSSHTGGELAPFSAITGR
uniref:non-specific serine/threonine protein kinase n=1 Tax=Kalanchoe fedtschenkoi TaxID=63787 RepID=A0A7N0UUX8_KALFE